MEEIIKAIINKLGTMPPLLAFIFIAIIGAGYLFKDVIVEKIRSIRWFSKQSNHHEKTEFELDDLKNHDIFNVIEDVRLTIKHHHFDGDVIKTKVFHDFINIMLNEIRNGMKQIIVTTIDLDKNEEVVRDELKLHVMKSLNMIVDRYCGEGKTHLLNKGIPYDDTEYVVALFEEWRAETRLGINNRISAVFASSFYPDNFTRLLAVFEIISVSVSLIPKDGVRSFEDMNGKFKTIKYN